MARYTAGDLAYLDYGEVPQVIHERLVAGHVDGTEYVIVTPDRDIYTESLDPSNPDIVRIWAGGARGGLRTWQQTSTALGASAPENIVNSLSKVEMRLWLSGGGGGWMLILVQARESKRRKKRRGWGSQYCNCCRAGGRQCRPGAMGAGRVRGWP